MSRLTRDGTAEPVSRDQILRHARGQGNIIFPVQLTTSRIGNLTRLIHTLLYVMTIHTYIHISKPSDVGTRVRISVSSHELGFFLTLCPTSGERLRRGYTKFHFTVDEGKGRLNLSRDKKIRQAPQKKEGGESNSCVVFPCLAPAGASIY